MMTQRSFDAWCEVEDSSGDLKMIYWNSSRLEEEVLEDMMVWALYRLRYSAGFWYVGADYIVDD